MSLMNQINEFGNTSGNSNNLSGISSNSRNRTIQYLNDTENAIENLGESNTEYYNLNDSSNMIKIGDMQISLDGLPEGIDVNFIEVLFNYGYEEKDIKRVTSGEISMTDLNIEIENDPDGSRRRKIMEVTSLYSFNYNYGLNIMAHNLDDLQHSIVGKKQELNVFRNSNNINHGEPQAILDIIELLKEGKDLDKAVKKIKDFNKLYPDSKLLEDLRSVLDVEENKVLFFWTDTDYHWSGSAAQLEFLNKVSKLNEDLIAKETELTNYEFVYTNLKSSIDFHMEYIDKYTHNADFSNNCGYSPYEDDKFLEKIANYNNSGNAFSNFMQMTTHSSSIAIDNTPNMYLGGSDFNDLTADFLYNLINGESHISGNFITIGTQFYKVHIGSAWAENYADWLPYMTNEEKNVFNYIYNTQGKEAGYNFLEALSTDLDNRWLSATRLNDEEFAKEHEVIASLGSVVVTPFEGMAAVGATLQHYGTGENLYRTNIYSHGDQWRNTVAAEINNETLSFLYSTGMSMLDSLTLVGLDVATGGMATVPLSAAWMGSRAYNSTLNNALDKGLSTDNAVLLAASSAAVETAMESYSVGHLANLEGKLGKLSTSSLQRIASVTNSKAATEIAYIALNALSQGIAEGEEELCTEVLNYVLDCYISGDLSDRETLIKEYMEQGFSREVATNMANDQFKSQLGQAFLGGFISGNVFGSVSGTRSTFEASQRAATLIDLQMNSTLEENQALENQIEKSKKLAEAKRQVTALQFAEQAEQMRIEAIEQEENLKKQKKVERKEFFNNIVNELFNESTIENINLVKKSFLGTILSLPETFNKFRLTPLSENSNLTNKAFTEGLYHITTEEGAAQIMQSGYVKAASNPITSYGSPKSFLFAGIPTMQDVSLNINYMEKAVAVRIKPTIEELSDSNFQYRAKDDLAIAHNGNYNFDTENAEIVYLGLVKNELGEYEYKEITHDEYIDYKPNFATSDNKIISTLTNNIKTFLYGISYQYDLLMHNVDRVNNLLSTSTNTNISHEVSIQTLTDYVDELIRDYSSYENEQLDFILKELKAKVSNYDSITDLANNFESLSEFQQKKLLSNFDIGTALVNSNPKIMDIIKTNFDNMEMLRYYVDYNSNFDSNSPLIKYLLENLSNEDIMNNNVSSINISIKSLLKGISAEEQLDFYNRHSEYFNENINKYLSSDFSDEFIITLLKNNADSKQILYDRKLKELSSNVQQYLFERYKNDIYSGSFKEFLEVIPNISGEYQTEIIKESPFYSEALSNSNFEKTFTCLNDSKFIIELFNNNSYKSKILDNKYCFKKFLSVLSDQQRSQFIGDVRQKIINDNFEFSLGDYLQSFNEQQINEILSDPIFISKLSESKILRLNKIGNNVYEDLIMSWISDDISSNQAKVIFDSDIRSKLSREDVIKCLKKLTLADANSVVNMGDAELLKIYLDSTLDGDYSKLNSVSSYYIERIYENLSLSDKINFVNNAPLSALVSILKVDSSENVVNNFINKLNDPETKLTDDIYKSIRNLPGEAYQKIMSSLSPAQKLYTYSVNNSEFINHEEILEVFRKSPSLISNLDANDGSLISFYEILSTKEDVDLFKENLTLDKYNQLYDYFKKTNNINYMAEFKEEFINKILTAQPNVYFVQNITNISEVAILGKSIGQFDFETQKEIIDSLNNSVKYELLMFNTLKNENIKRLIIKDMINDNNLFTSINSSYLSSYNDFFNNLSIDDINFIMENMSDNFLGLSMAITDRKDLNSLFSEKVNNNPLILANYDSIASELIFNNLSIENKNIITSYINQKLNEINSEKVNSLLSDASVSQKSMFIQAYNNGLINDEKVELLNKLKSKNQFVLSTFNYALFDDQIYQLGENMITKLSKYYDVVDQIMLLKNDQNKFNLFTKVIVDDETSFSDLVSDQKMAYILNYLLNYDDIDTRLFDINSESDIETVRNIILKQINQFSILDGNNKEIITPRSIITPDNFTVQNYQEQLNAKCDQMMQSVTNVEDAKNIMFNKYFSMSYEDALELYRIYGDNFGNVSNYDTSEGQFVTKYYENIKNILDISNLEEMKALYHAYGSSYSVDDMFNLINETKKIYTRSIKDTLLDVGEVTRYVTYNGKQIPIYEPTGDFQMLIQSTETNYGGMPIINGSYYDSWNLSSRTQNHGICCSLISNDNMGMAAVKGKGVIIGFSNFSDEQINMMAPYDIYTRNDGYVIGCQRPIQFLAGQDVMDETRHTHNEFNLERVNLDGNSNLANIQPDYVVIFEEMSEELKNNAYQASLDFNIPIVYISKEQLAANQSAKIDSLIQTYNTTSDVTLLKEILNIHENNRAGYRNPTDSYLNTQYFTPDRINDVLNRGINNANNTQDLIYIKELLLDEVRKFDATLEATHRANKIDINVTEMIERIDIKLSSLGIN